jgi:superfamily II DNA or RNA helicase
VKAKTRRASSRPLRERLYQRSRGACERCGNTIDVDTFHVSHLRAHANGGALVEQNTAAWCAPCNLAQGAGDVADTRLVPREWQSRALGAVVEAIAGTGVATVAAAPGAGKTVFAGLVFEALRDLDLVDRMVVLAPRRTIVSQWQASLRSARHLELRANAGIEGRSHDGVVVTYQSLGNPLQLAVHVEQAARSRTLLVLDEVHHVGEALDGEGSAWARAVGELAGDVEDGLRVAGVLNLSGTPWRSARSERISTVRYRQAGAGLESVVDFEVTPRELIARGELRPVELFRLDGQVKIEDRKGEAERIESAMCDLDEEGPARAALAALGGFAEYRQALVAAVLDRLTAARNALGGHPVKALIVANRQVDARAFRAEVVAQMRDRGLVPYALVAVSDDDDPGRMLDEFRSAPRMGVLCTVDMAGEGYDCPDIAVIGYAANKLTVLYVRQVIARAMRVTDVERQGDGVLPAAVVAPDVPALVEVLADHLAPYAPELEALSDEDEDNEAVVGDGGQVWVPRWLVTEVAPEDVVTVEQFGQTHRFEVGVWRAAEAECERNGWSADYAPTLAYVNQRLACA